MNNSNAKGFLFLLDPMEYKTIPCQRTCPLHVDISRYMYLVARERFNEAIEVIRKTNPFPSVCGRICAHNCEMGCTRAHVDRSVSICKVERASSDYGRSAKTNRKGLNIGKKVAIIGSGPCGLTAALDLTRTGYRVTVFEKAPVAGGSIRLGIARFRIPHDVVDKEIQYISDMGVDIRTDTAIGKDIGFEELKRDYHAIFIAAGAYSGGRLELSGSAIDGAINGDAFMVKINTGKVDIHEREVVVIGGGYTALDAARTCIRLGVKKVSIVFSQSRKNMKNSEEELKAAEEEGVSLYLLTTPTKIISDSNNKMKGLECIKVEMKGKEANPLKGSEFVINADLIINALNKTPDNSFLPEALNFEFSKTGLLAANSKTLATNVPGVFIGGDYLTGSRDIVNSIADGHKAALSINSYLKQEEEAPKPHDVETLEAALPGMGEDYETIKRRIMPVQNFKERISNFEEVEIGLSKSEAVLEAQRCLQCNNMWMLIDDRCIQCNQCVLACPTDCLSMAELNPEQNYQFFYEGLDLQGEKIPPIAITMKLCIRCGVCADVCPSDAIVFKTCEPAGQKTLQPAI
tara:strand:+ start:27662 stop:29386 length:1725 start_codon:yes stop_codon:yes gene_type:complete